MISKVFQRNGVLLSDVTASVEDAEYTMDKLTRTPGRWMKAFEKDYDPDRLALDGIELHTIEEGTRPTTQRNSPRSAATSRRT